MNMFLHGLNVHVCGVAISHEIPVKAGAVILEVLNLHLKNSSAPLVVPHRSECHSEPTRLRQQSQQQLTESPGRSKVHAKDCGIAGNVSALEQAVQDFLAAPSTTLLHLTTKLKASF